MRVNLTLTSVITTRTSVILHDECDFHTYCNFDTHECDYDTHDCDFKTHKSDFYMQSVFLARVSVILTQKSVTVKV
jgi:hypothetical protein